MRFKKAISIDELCSITGSKSVIKGNKEIRITGINEIHSVEPGDVSFVDHPKYYDKVLNSLASVILINKDVEVPNGKTIIISDDPLDDFMKIVNHFVKFTPQTEPIHSHAVIGENTIIQPNVFIGENVTIGANCIIHANVSIYADTIIGDNVVIHSGCVIGADAFYFQKRENGWKKLYSCGRTVISDDVEIGSNVSIDKGVSGDTFIGKGAKFDNLVQVGHDTHIGNYCLIGSQSAIAGCTFIDDECIIWAKSSVNKDLYLAPRTTILAVSAIDKSIHEEGQVLFGVPAIDVRKKWKEMAYQRKLPELFEEYEELKKKLKLETK